jgi:hypothetical protein
MLLELVKRPVAPRRRPHCDGSRLERAAAYLHAAGPAVAGELGNTKTYKLACFLVRDSGLSDGDALKALVDWNVACVPPWSDAELEAFVRHARKYGKHATGAAT